MEGIQIKMLMFQSDWREQLLANASTQNHDVHISIYRLQLMCYKYLWDNLVADSFPSKQFFDFFTLDPYYILSKEIRENTAKSGFSVKVKILYVLNQ